MNDILKLQTKPSLSPRKPARQEGPGTSGGSGSVVISSSVFKSFWSIRC